MVPGIRDREDELVTRLDRLVTILEQKEFGTTEGDTFNITENINETIHVGDRPTTDNTGAYFSTGKDPVRLEPENGDRPWERIDFGQVVAIVNVRFTADLLVSFKNPNVNEGGVISLDAAESPFTIGGAAGLETAFMWVKIPESVNQNDIQVIAFR